MKKKYYFRGLGVGILVTAILFSIVLIFYKPTMSDEEIKKRATELGMTESTEDAKKTDAITPSSGASGASDESGAEDETAAQNASGAATASGASDESGASNTTVTENPDGSTTTTTTILGEDAAKNASDNASTDNTAAPSSDFGTVTIKGGEDSRIVAKNLKDAGIIEDDTDFNNYLESNKYDRYILNGSFNIKKGASYDEIVHTITSK